MVSDAGPLIHLAQINQLVLLKGLFGSVIVAQKVKNEVIDEGLSRGYADATLIAAAFDEGWLKIEPFPNRLVESAAKLAVGEHVSQADAQTLLLAKSKNAQLLVDEKVLSSIAKMYGLKTWNTWTVLLEGLSKKQVEVSRIENAVEELGKKKFKLNPEQAQLILDAARQIDKQNKFR